MKRGLVILIGAIAVGLSMFLSVQMTLGSRQEAAQAIPKEKDSLLPELHWLENWLGLDADQTQKVKALHLAYLPKCEELCHRVHRSNEEVLALSGRRPQMDAPMRRAIQERAQLTVECQQALLEHVYQTAACLRPDQSRKYLDLMVPYTLGISAKHAASNGSPP